MFHNRLYSKDQLRRRNVIQDARDMLCVLCFKEEENIYHIFLNCSFVHEVWKGAEKWINKNIELDELSWKNFTVSRGMLKGSTKEDKVDMIWLAAWCV